MIASIRHKDLILRVASNIPWVEELSISTPLLTKLEDEVTIQGENLQQCHQRELSTKETRTCILWLSLSVTTSLPIPSTQTDAGRLN